MDNQNSPPAATPVNPSGTTYVPPPTTPPPPVSSETLPPPTKSHSGILIAGIILLVILIAGGGFMYFMNVQKPTPKIQPAQTITTLPTLNPTPTTVSTESANTLFDVEKVKIGDTIGTMTIKKLGGYKGLPVSSDSAIVQFTGKVPLTGEIVYNKPGGFLTESVCMQNLDTESLAKIPKMLSDTRDVWFCFNDLVTAKKDLVINEKGKNPATVMIDNYQIIYYPSEVFNTADFIAETQP